MERPAVTGREIIDFVFEIAPNPAWADENVFEFGDGSGEVAAVGVAWRITSDIMLELGRGGFQLGLTHKRVPYDLVTWYPWGQIPAAQNLAANRRLGEIASSYNLSIHRFQSNLDLAPWGIGPSLLKQLEWDKRPTDWSRGVPVIDIDAIPLHELNRLVKARLDLPFVRYDGEPERIIRRIAVSLGGMRRLPASWGGSWCAGWDGAACASPLGFDAIIGGDLTDGLVRFARENDWAVIDAMHHATEMQVMRVLTRRLQNRFPNLRVEFFANSCPWQLRA